MQNKKSPVSWMPVLNKKLAPDFNQALTKLLDAQTPLGNHVIEELTRILLQEAFTANATDIHIEPFSQGFRFRFRIDGELHDSIETSQQIGTRIQRHLKSLAGLDPVAAFMPQDAHTRYGLGHSTVDLRIASVPCECGEKLALRILDTVKVDHRIDQLGMNSDTMSMLSEWMEVITGMCLVTGPTGSGKTTTLYALLHELKINTKSIVTIEDPVEYQIDGITQIQVDPRHGLTFSEGLKTMQRLDPDYQLVGEIRDPASARAAIEASGSGRALMSTLHSRDVIGVVTMLRNWNIHNLEIATALELVIAQRLVRRLCTKCAYEEKPTSKESLWLKSIGRKVPRKTWHAGTCKTCFGTGYKGRIGVFEIWRKDDSDYEALLKGLDEQSMRQHFKNKKVNTLLDDGLAKVDAGITSIDEIRHMGANVNLQT